MAQTIKNLPAMWETRFDPWVGKIPERRAWQPTLVFVPGESHWPEEPGWLQFMRLQRVGHNRVTKHSTKRNDTNELIYKTETDSQTQRTNLLVTTGGGGGEGIVREFEIDLYILLCLKWIANNDLLYGIGNFVPFYVVAWTEGEFGENGHTYVHG